MGKHDELVCKLDKTFLAKLMVKNFYKSQGVWSSHHWIGQKNVEAWNYDDLKALINTPRPQFNGKTLLEIGNAEKKSLEFIKNLSEEESVMLEVNYEFPLIKGDAQYKVTKGFLDIIVHCNSVEAGMFLSYQNHNPIEVFIEVKTEKDFQDVGLIIRQIKEYCSYYSDSCQKWDSHILGGRRAYNTWSMNGQKLTDGVNYFWMVISDKIPPMAKEMLKREQIICIELEPEEGK